MKKIIDFTLEMLAQMLLALLGETQLSVVSVLTAFVVALIFFSLLRVAFNVGIYWGQRQINRELQKHSNAQNVLNPLGSLTVFAAVLILLSLFFIE
jgi:hypothetical protein